MKRRNGRLLGGREDIGDGVEQIVSAYYGYMNDRRNHLSIWYQHSKDYATAYRPLGGNAHPPFDGTRRSGEQNDSTTKLPAYKAQRVKIGRACFDRNITGIGQHGRQILDPRF